MEPVCCVFREWRSRGYDCTVDGICRSHAEEAE